MASRPPEWVADWVPLSTACTGWGGVSDDRMCLAGASTDVGGPGALTRGGSFVDGTGSGPLAVVAGRRPSVTLSFVGFRCTVESPGPLPAEVDNGVRVSRSGSDAVIRWNIAAGATASAVLRGHVSALPVGSAGADERCLVAHSGADALTDPELPASGDGFWYLVRGENVLGDGPYGFEGLHGVLQAARVELLCALRPRTRRRVRRGSSSDDD